MKAPRPVDRKRWRQRIAAQLEDAPRQLGVLSSAIANFGDDFDLEAFAAAYESDDIQLYEGATLVEAAVTRVQGMIVQLCEDGARLASLGVRPHRKNEPGVAAFLDALVEEEVITKTAARKLTAAQGVRNLIEHAYVNLPATKIHRAAADLAALAPEFLGRYTDWIEPYLDPHTEEGPRQRKS